MRERTLQPRIVRTGLATAAPSGMTPTPTMYITSAAPLALLLASAPVAPTSVPDIVAPGDPHAIIEGDAGERDDFPMTGAVLLRLALPDAPGERTTIFECRVCRRPPRGWSATWGSRTSVSPRWTSWRPGSSIRAAARVSRDSARATPEVRRCASSMTSSRRPAPGPGVQRSFVAGSTSAAKRAHAVRRVPAAAIIARPKVTLAARGEPDTGC